MTQCEAHFEETRKLAEQLDPDDLARWLLHHGYFPEQYVLPPSFAVQKYDLKPEPYFAVAPRKNPRFKPTLSELETLSFPRSPLTVRAFGIVEPRIYHDLVWHITREWKTVVDRLFYKQVRIYSYSFPIPVTTKDPGRLSHLRTGRMIYEFIEMAENDLVGEAHKYRFLLRTDVTNCYATIYTHSVSWALHGKQSARDDRSRFSLVGSKIDKLLQNANDGRTNGIAVGPAICDLISEIVLAAVDRRCSAALAAYKMDFLGVRFKDDYRFLCASEDDAHTIARTLQKSLNEYNLTLSENKSEVRQLPEGLFRPWTSSYQHWSLRWKRTINYRSFESTLLSVLRIDEQFPGTGIIDRFLSELTSRRLNLKLKLNESEARKTYSLLLLLKQRRARSFPSILAVVEAILNKYENYKDLLDYVAESLTDLLGRAALSPDENEYDIVWILYFLRVVLGRTDTMVPASSNRIVLSVATATQCFYDEHQDASLFEMVTYPAPRNHLLQHLAIFHRTNDPDSEPNPNDKEADV